MTKRMVEAGQKYRAVKMFDYVWHVDAVNPDHKGRPHAMMHRFKDDHELRTLACEVLLDRQQFQLVD
jgi:hypothetical protein